MRDWYARFTPEERREKRMSRTTRENRRRRPEDHQTRELVRQKTRRAIANGSLIKGVCERCGDEKVHAHHEDYAKPLDVNWLCPLHHSERHREREREQGVREDAATYTF